MKQVAYLTLLASLAVSARSAAAQIAGDWEGAITIAGQTLPFVVHLVASDDAVSGTIDIQGVTGIRLQNVSHDHPSLRFELAAGAGLAVWDGTHEGSTVAGTFTQAGMEGTFSMGRLESPPPRTEATDASPTTTEEVAFTNGAVSLAGTLTLPEGSGPHPALVFISGSGAQDRDETLFGFKPFAILADALAGVGIASLRYDDRGVGGSTGNVSNVTSLELAEDVAAAIELLRARPDIDGEAVGMLGHSEGGLIAPIVAGNDPDVAFVILLAGPAMRGDEILYLQGERILTANGAGSAALARQRQLQERIFSALRSNEGWADLRAELDAQVREQLASMPEAQREAITDEDGFVVSQVEAQIRQVQSPWFRFFIDYDPRPALEDLRTPVLAVFGALDLQVPAEENATAMRATFDEGGHPDFAVHVLDRANHLFQAAETGSPTEYATLPKAFVGELVPLITEWITARIP